MKTTVRQLRASIRQLLREYYDDYDDDSSGGNNDASMVDFDPILIEIPAFEEAFSGDTDVTGEGPNGVAFTDSFAWQIIDVLESGEPNWEDEEYEYDEQNEEYVIAKKIWDVAENGGLDNSTLISNLKAAMEEAEEAGYNY